MNVTTVVTEVRRLIQDTEQPYRYDDDMLVGYVNQTLQRMAIMRPDLFAYVDTVATVQDSVIQSAPADSIRIMDVFNVSGGNGVVETSKVSLDQTYPQWVNDPAGACVNWMRHARNPNKYFIYPKAPAGQQLVIEYAQAPQTYALGDTIALLPDAYLPVVIDGTVYLAQSIDDEHVLTQRAQMFMQSFTATLGATLENRVLTDSDEPTSGVREGGRVSG